MIPLNEPHTLPWPVCLRGRLQAKRLPRFRSIRGRWKLTDAMRIDRRRSIRRPQNGWRAASPRDRIVEKRLDELRRHTGRTHMALHLYVRLRDAWLHIK